MAENKREVAVVAVVAVVVVVMATVLLVFSGTQVSTILSKVGAAVTPMGDSGGAQSGTETGDGTGDGAPTEGSGSADVAAIQPLPLLIIHKGTLTLEVTSIVPAVAGAAELVTASGGFVAGSTERGSGSDEAATADYRIPAAAWERTLARLRGLASVRGQTISTEEVTGQVADLGARIANLRATEAALQAIMAKASKIDDVLAVQKQLTDTRGQIEELVAQKVGLEDRAAFGSLTVTFNLPVRPAPSAAPPPGWDPGRDIDAASAKLVRIGQKATTAGIWFAIVGLPILVALAVALGIAWLAYRLISRRRPGDGAAAA